jgi:hypothetical protein
MPLYEFQPSFTVDQTDLTLTSTGSGVHFNKAVTVDLGILDRISGTVSSNAELLANNYVNSISVDILNINGSSEYTNFLTDYKSNIFTFTEYDNINVFGKYTKDFGVRFTLSESSETYTSEFYLYGNLPEFSGIQIQDSTGTTFHSSSESSKTAVNSTGQTGALTSVITFNNDIAYTAFNRVDVYSSSSSSEFASQINPNPIFSHNLTNEPTQSFDINEGSLPSNTPVYLHYVPYANLGSGAAWTVGPYTFEDNPTPTTAFLTTDQSGNFVQDIASVLAVGNSSEVLDFSSNKLVFNVYGSSEDVSRNSVNSFASVILLGTKNKIFGDYDAIVGGTTNVISGDATNPSDFNFIGAGSGNDITGSDYSSTIGGYNNDIFSSDYSVLGGGKNNLLKDNTACFIGGGVKNEIQDGYASFIGGGDTNKIYSHGSVIAGGVFNLITGDGYSFIGGGEGNSIYSLYGSILGGENNLVSGKSSSVLGGFENHIYGEFSVIAGGESSRVSGDYASAIGRRIKIQDSHSGALVLADGQNRDHFSNSEHSATLDFANGVYINTGDLRISAGDVSISGSLNATGDITMGGNVVLTGIASGEVIDALGYTPLSTEADDQTLQEILDATPSATGTINVDVFSGVSGVLDVIQATGDLTLRPLGSDGNGGKLILDGDSFATALQIENYGNIIWGASTYNFGLGSTYWQWKSWAKPIHIVGGAGTVMYIGTPAGDGNVGIGTTSPNEKLEVDGSVLATSFKKSGGSSGEFLKADGSVDSNSYLTSLGTAILDGDFTVSGLMKRSSDGVYTSVTDNSSNWNTAYTDRNKWDGGATGLNAATGRASLGLGTAATVDSSEFATAAQGTYAETAFGWGDHASGGYAATGHTHANATSGSAGFISSADFNKLSGIAASANNYSLPTGTSSVLGGFKIGYSESGQNYPVEVLSGQMFVTVPWTDANTTYSVGSGISLSGTTFSVAAGGGLTQTATGLSHTDTSSQASVDNNNGTVIQDVFLDTYGHITGIGSTNLDSRYNNYSLPAGTSSERGGFKIGYSETGQNYPVEVSSEQMFVTVPWVDTIYTLTSGDITGALGFSPISTETDDQTLDEVLAQGNSSELGIDVGAITGSALTIDTNTLFVDSTNNRVGIGTTSPSDKLEVYANGADVALRIHEDAGTHQARLHLRRGGSDWEIINDNNLTIESEGSEKMRITTTGNVGIGTTSPSAVLHVEDTSLGYNQAVFKVVGSASAVVQIDGQGTVWSPKLNLTDTNQGIARKGGGQSRIWASSSIDIEDKLTNHLVRFDTVNLRVGIGTTSPTNKLDIRQSSSSGSDVIGTGAITIGSDNPYWTFRGTATSLQDLAFDRSYGGTWYESMRIQRSSGNVGIGTNSPSEKLTVHSTATAIATFYTTNASGGFTGYHNSTGGVKGFVGYGSTLFTGLDINNFGLRSQSGMPFATGGGNIRMYINSSGNVGIGTTNPSAKLEVAISENVNSYSDGAIQVVSSSPIAFVAPSNLNPSLNRWGFTLREGGEGHFGIRDYRHANTRVTIDDNGNVGIGTTSPDNILHIAAPAPRIRLEDTLDTSNYSVIAADNGQLVLSADEGNNQGNSAQIFKIDNSEKMRITSAGNVGIGTTSPYTTLQVGNSNDSVGISTNVKLYVADGGIRVGSTSGSDFGYRFFRDSSSGDLVFIGDQNGNTNYNFQNYAGTSLLRIKSDGNVGIGDTTPSYKLDVNGTLRAVGAATFDSNVTIAGDLTVNGTTTTINSTTVQVYDKNIELGTVATPTDTTADGGGITLLAGSSESDHKTIKWINSTDAWTFSNKVSTSEITTASGTLTLNPAGGFVFLPSGKKLYGSNIGFGYQSNAVSAIKFLLGPSIDNPDMRIERSSSNLLIQNEVADGDILFKGSDGGSTITALTLDMSEGGNATFSGSETNFASGSMLDWANGDARIIEGAHSNNYSLSFQTFDGSSCSTKMNILGNGNVGIGTTTPCAKLEVNGHFAATTKSFIIPNPKKGGRLQYGVVETDEHSVYIRGKSNQNLVELPEEWEWLVDEDSVTVQLTSIGQIQQLFVTAQNNKYIKVCGLANNGEYNYVVYGTRKDVDPLQKNLK